MKLSYIRFTPKEWEVIAHRLGAADAIADALTDHADGEEPAVPDTPEAVEAEAHAMLDDGRCLLIATDLRRAVLLDACDGSTFLGGLEFDERAAWLPAVRSIERKIRDELGESVTIPRE